MMISKISRMENKNLILISVLILVITLIAQTTVLADNVATQSATTTSAATILIRNVTDSADVSTITFPSGAPSAVISNPTGSDLQVLTSTASEAAPVAILTSTAAYTLWYNVTSTATWGDAVASERFYTQAVATDLDLTTFGSGADEMTVWDTDQETTQALAANVDEELFLQITLSAQSGKTGTSTLTVLGETP